MDLAIGLPNAVPGTTREALSDFAKAAEDAGFSSLGTIDRIVYPNIEPITALTTAAAVTDRIGLATTVMLAPLRANAAMIAKQALSLDSLAGGGRVMLGVAVGGREDDYEVSNLPIESAAPGSTTPWARCGGSSTARAVSRRRSALDPKRRARR